MNYFVELTNPIHGGEGWELGEVLWSPKENSWKIMNTPKPGDIIIHSVKEKENINHKFWGFSLVGETVRVVDIEPTIPGKWADHDFYYRITLTHYQELHTKPFVQEFLNSYEQQIKDNGPWHSFFNEKGVLKPAQKYLAALPEKLFNWIEQFLDLSIATAFAEYDNDEITTSRPGDTEMVVSSFEEETTRVTTTIERIIRNTRIIRTLKIQYDNKCQICGHKITLPRGATYSEGHHLRKLGGAHQGPDVKENIILVCPNHHVEFDFGAISIDPKTKLIKHIDEENFFHNKKLAYDREDLEEEFLSYHHRYLFAK